MPLVAVLLVVGAAACHCAWNLILKSASDRAEVSLGALVVGAVLASPVLAVYALRDVSLEGWQLIALSGVFETAYVIALTAAYGAGDLSLVYPIARGTPALLVAPLSVALLGERCRRRDHRIGPRRRYLSRISLPVGRHGWAGSHGRAVVPVSRASRSPRLVREQSWRERVPVPLATLVFAVDAVLLVIVLRARGGLRGHMPRGGWRPASRRRPRCGFPHWRARRNDRRRRWRTWSPRAATSCCDDRRVCLGERASATGSGRHAVFAGLVAIALSR